MTNFTPASSRLLPSAAIFTRVSESGTRLIQQAIFMWGKAKLGLHHPEHSDAPIVGIVGGIIIPVGVRVRAVRRIAQNIGPGRQRDRTFTHSLLDGTARGLSRVVFHHPDRPEIGRAS